MQDHIRGFICSKSVGICFLFACLFVSYPRTSFEMTFYDLYSELKCDLQMYHRDQMKIYF